MLGGVKRPYGSGESVPVYVKKIQIGSYRHLQDIELGTFMPPSESSELVVLAGPNGSGKSSILELISIGLSTTWSLTYGLNRTSPQSSFEITFGLLPSEVQLIEKTDGADTDVVAYLQRNQHYYRAFNFETGEYQKNTSLQNKIHSAVIAVLRGSHSRSLGFKLGSERSYLKRPFNRNTLFQYRAFEQSAHIWSFAFQASEAQYTDMFDFLVTWRYHFLRRLGRYHQQLAAGTAIPDDAPIDEYGLILSRVFPDYSFVDMDEDAPTDLFVSIPSGETISFSDLSSGEKEVFFTLCFFQRHRVEEAVIVIDEPELHLHPSLARRLLRVMQELKPRNQLWLATQSSEVVDEAGRDNVWFIRREDAGRAVVFPATKDEPTLAYLRDFFGYSGYIGLAKAMIFTEGRHASADRKMFSRLFPHSGQEIKFIPAAGCSESLRINKAVMAILEADVAWCRFYLIRDRDYLDDQMAAAVREKAGDNFFILERHEIENYLLDFEVIASVLKDIFDVSQSPSQIRDEFETAARSIAGNVLRDMVSFRLNYRFRSEDFSVPKLHEGELQIDRTAGWTVPPLDALRTTLSSHCDVVVRDLSARVGSYEFDALFDGCRQEIERAVTSEGWINVFPGKELMQQFCHRLGLGKPPILQNSIIKELSRRRDQVPPELSDIIERVLA